MKVIMTQGKELEHALSGEEDDKDQVDPEEDFGDFFALVVRLHHHGDHVQTDQHHDQDVKELLCDNVEDEALETVLQQMWGKRFQYCVFWFHVK